MIRKILVLVGVLLLISANVISEKKKSNYSVTNPVYKKYNFPYIEKNFVAFKEAVAFKESQGKYNVVNTLGYLGKYQFGKGTLERFRIYNKDAFLKNPELQEKTFLAYCKVNKWILRKDIKRSVGKTINGIVITESGILAAAHLSGAGNVKKFLRSNGEERFKDAYGTSISYYLKSLQVTMFLTLPLTKLQEFNYF